MVSKALCCRTDYPVPKIKSISTLGDLVISWNKDMQVPQNETYFIEQLNSKVLVSEAGSDTLIEELAFELKLRDNSANTKAINMTWEFDGWSSSREMNFKLTFNNPIAVSVAIEPDFIEVLYRNQSLFLAEDDSYIEFNKVIEKQIPPQLEDNAATASLSTGAQAVKAGLAGVGIVTLISSLFISAALNYLWGLLNAL